MDLVGLIPTFGNLIWTVAAFVVALSVIVAIHEYGHYIVGRWCGIRAEVFSLGFGPQIAAWRDRRGTLWQISALPLGGYVRFWGDSDAASTGADGRVREMTPAELRQTLHGAPLWARAATVAAGPAFNFALSILVFAAVVMWQGRAVEPLTVAALKPLPVAEIGLQPGDRILSIDGQPVTDLAAFDGLGERLAEGPQHVYRVEREGAETDLRGPYPWLPLVSFVSPKSAAMEAGLRPGDFILSANGTALGSFEDLRDAVVASSGAALRLQVWRDGETFEAELTPRQMDVPLPDGGFEQRYLIGVTGGLFFEPATASPGVLAALGDGVSQTWYIAAQSISGLWHMITGAISSCNLSGPIGIAESSGAAAAQGLDSFVWFIGVLSAAVGLLNLFPVPVLDGGHLMFFAYEAVAGRPPSDRALRALMAGGLSLILALMVFALGNDIFC